MALALGASTGPLVVLAGGIIGQALAPSPRLATLPVTALILGVACFAVPAALVMGRIGHRAGFMIGAGISATGALIAAATSAASFPAFCAATFVMGAAAFGRWLAPSGLGRDNEPARRTPVSRTTP